MEAKQLPLSDGPRKYKRRSDVVNLIGMRFGKFSVVESAPSRNGQTVWLCLCDCGNKVAVRASNLKSGSSKSCGCGVFKHGLKGTRQYQSWNSMIQRCTNQNSKRFKDYGGRGITVCKRWRTFANFWEDMGATYSDELTLDRIKNSGNYEPGNCRWATALEQGANTRKARLVTVNGVTRTVSQWSIATGVCRATMDHRVRHGWSIEDAVSTPPLQSGSGRRGD